MNTHNQKDPDVAVPQPTPQPQATPLLNSTDFANNSCQDIEAWVSAFSDCV